MKTNFKAFLLLCVCAWGNIKTYAQALWEQQDSPKYEIRAVWLTTIGGIDWPHSYQDQRQREELRQELNRLKEAGINTVFLQTRVRATTIYPSAFEPWDGCISGTPGKAPTYDPLKFAVEECHQRGIQLHAWVVTIPIGKWNKYGCQQLRKKRPKMLTKIGDEGYLNPERPETADYLTVICQEIVENYDVDGIHLDYIRYPETWKMRVSSEQGRANITRITRNIYRKVKTLKPWVMVSCSPIGKHDNLTRYSSNGWNARSRVCQDAQQWLKEGIMDALFPMMYFRDNNFFPFAIDWKERSYGRFVVPGLGIFFLDPREGKWALDDVERQLHVSRALGLGHCYFRTKFFLDNTQGVYDFGKKFNSVPSLVPPMNWLSSVKPEAPKDVRIEKRLSEKSANGIQESMSVISWQTEKNMVYNVYASESYPVDITKASNLIATRLAAPSLVIDGNRPLHYAVTGQDRFGQESDASQVIYKSLIYNNINNLNKSLVIDDKTTDIPFKPSTLDADYIMIQTLQGTTIKIFPYHGYSVNISNLPNGIYQWRSLGKKGRNHRIGFFSVKHK